MKDPTAPGYRIKIPGKTFLVGEYLALAGGPSIVVNTTPCFEFSWESRRSSEPRNRDASVAGIHHPFHEKSPAGKWLNQPLQTKEEYFVQFKDPFDGKGGLGASTAEFAGAWVFRNWLRDSLDWLGEIGADGSIVGSLEDHRETLAPLWKSEKFGSNRFRDILDDYRMTTNRGSGADLVSQVSGGLAVWDARLDEMRRFRWPFRDLSLTLLLTGKKLPTHEHLAQLDPLESGVTDEMRLWVEEAVQSFALEDADRLVASVRGFGKVLGDTGRLADHSRSLLEDLADCSGVRAAKGCGAMGSDVLLVLHDRGAVAQLSEFRELNGLRQAATDADIWAKGVILETREGVPVTK